MFISERTKAEHRLLMWFRRCLLDECVRQLKWPVDTTAEEETNHKQPAYRTLWVLLQWWHRAKPEEPLTGVFNQALTRMWREDPSQIWRAITPEQWLDRLYDTEAAVFGYDALDAEERTPSYIKPFPPTEEDDATTPWVRFQRDALYEMRQFLVHAMPVELKRLPEHFPERYDPEEMRTLYVLLQCPLCDVGYVTRERSTLRVVALFKSENDQRLFWLQCTRQMLLRAPRRRILQGGRTHSSSILLTELQQQPRSYFPGLLETDAFNGFRIKEGKLSVPMYARVWLMLLHFAYESLGFPTLDARDAEAQLPTLFEEIAALRGALPQLNGRPWWGGAVDTAFWEELAQNMQQTLAETQAAFDKAAWANYTEGLGDFIAGLE
jgi:hypothetical protein